MNTSFTIQDLPDDILQMIVQHLDVIDTTKFNIALVKRYKTKKITNIAKYKSIKHIPKEYHKYINVCYSVGDTQLKYHRNVYGLIYEGFDHELKDLVNLKKLVIMDTYVRYLYNIDSLTYLDCEGSEIHDVNELVTLKFLNCAFTNINNIDNLVNLETLICYRSKITNLDNQVNLTNLDISSLDIDKDITININHLIKLVRLECDDKICFDKRKLPNLKYLKIVKIQ